MNRGEFLKSLAFGLGAAALFPRISSGDPAGPMILGGETEVNPHFASHGNGFGNRIAVTFDDGPTPRITEKVLSELEKHRMRATFFMIGQRVKAEPSLAKAVADAGHEIGNHSYTHPQLAKMPASRVEEELSKTQDAIMEATGKKPQWFRPPYGSFIRSTQGPIAEKLGLGVVYWSVDPRDWSQPGVPVIISRVLAGAQPGSIILMHDLHPQTAEAVSTIFDGLQEKFFAFDNMSRLLGNPYPPSGLV